MLPHVRTAADLVTPHDAVRDGFLSQALAKTEKAVPYIQNAQLLWAALQEVERVETLLGLPLILPAVNLKVVLTRREPTSIEGLPPVR